MVASQKTSSGGNWEGEKQVRGSSWELRYEHDTYDAVMGMWTKRDAPRGEQGSEALEAVEKWTSQSVVKDETEYFSRLRGGERTPRSAKSYVRQLQPSDRPQMREIR
jgi:hypothetical protein